MQAVPPDEMLLRCEQLDFGYSRKLKVLDKFDYNFRTGITVLKGYSGSGKTTLLKLLAGYLTPNGGRVISPTKNKVGSRRYLQRDIGYMFQGINLLPLLSVERNLRLAAEMAILPSKLWKTRCQELLHDLGLDEMRRRRADRLSGGQAQRAALARTLMKNSPIVLLDEPTSGLDDGNTAIICRRIIAESTHKICIISTHDARLFPIAHEIIDFDALVSG